MDLIINKNDSNKKRDFRRILLIGTDSNNGGSTQMLLKKTQIETCCHIILQRGEGNLSALSVHMSFYKLFPTLKLEKITITKEKENFRGSMLRFLFPPCVGLQLQGF